MLTNQEAKWEKLKILDFLVPEAVTVDLKGATKPAVLEELVGLLDQAKKILDARKVMALLLEREKLGSTGIGQGIAIPHTKSDQVREIVAACGVSRKGIDFDALDGEPVHLLFILIAPLDSSGLHLKALARISRLLKDKFFRQVFREAKDPEEVLRIIREEDQY